MEFNSRLQAEEIRLSSGSSNLLALNYGYGSANNSGNVLSQQIAMPGLSLTQNYAYDTLNRLETASETGSWSQSYGYDRYGNRWVASGAEYGNDPALTPTAQSDFDASTNRLAGATYDAAGNLTVDAVGRTFDYDAENRQIAFEGGLAQYSYDGEGRRVKKQAGAEVTIYVYNILGQLAAEYSTAANAESGPKYLTADHLGSTRVVTDQTGGILSRYDYLPFGEEIAAAIGNRSSVPGYNSPDNLNHKFTGKERDGESGLDYFGARYHSGAQGRFTTPDPKLSGAPFPEHLVQPQSWNMYSYTLNNPFKFVDPDGEDIELVVSFQGNFTDEEKRKILEATKRYLARLDVGKVVVRQSTDADKRTWGQFFKDANPLTQTGYFKIGADPEKEGMSKPHLVKLGDLAELRRRDLQSFLAKAADAVLHEVLSHQLGVGFRHDALIFGKFAPSSILHRAQQNDPYFQSRRNTLFDHAQWRAGDLRVIRPLHEDDQKKIEERFKPITRKYEE